MAKKPTTRSPNMGQEGTIKYRREDQVSDLTIAGEFLMTALRAAVLGGAMEGRDVRAPLRFALSKVGEVLRQIEDDMLPEDKRLF